MYTLICTLALALFAGFDWNYIVHDSPARIVAVSGTLCVLLQVLKRYLPAVNGWLAVALNFTLSACGILAITRPDQIWTVATWQNVIVTGLAAAGIHGTSKLMGAKANDTKTALPATSVLLAFAVGMGMLLMVSPARAQDAPAPSRFTTGYAGGVSYNPGADKPIAGSGLFFHSIAGSDNYAFTAIDAIPTTVRPFAVSTNIGVGIARKVTSISGIDIFAPVATGIQLTGANVGWQYNGGVAAVIPYKNTPYFLMPTVRFNKGSVSNNSGYQIIAGINIGFGQK
jgi:hypothetical protein